MKPFAVAVSRQGRISLLLLSFFTMILGATVPARALTYTYVGSAFSVADCEVHTGYSAPPCTDGSITASVTFTGIAPGSSGNFGTSDISSFSMTATPIGSLNNSNYWGATIIMSGGQIYNWMLTGCVDSSADTLCVGAGR
jgi:hypothetical protein